jgi:hypothetical protein
MTTPQQTCMEEIKADTSLFSVKINEVGHNRNFFNKYKRYKLRFNLKFKNG